MTLYSRKLSIKDHSSYKMSHRLKDLMIRVHTFFLNHFIIWKRFLLNFNNNLTDFLYLNPYFGMKLLGNFDQLKILGAILGKVQSFIKIFLYCVCVCMIVVLFCSFSNSMIRMSRFCTKFGLNLSNSCWDMKIHLKVDHAHWTILHRLTCKPAMKSLRLNLTLWTKPLYPIISIIFRIYQAIVEIYIFAKFGWYNLENIYILSIRLVILTTNTYNST